MTWKPEPGMTKRQIEKELNRQAVMFEEACNRGFRTTAMKFQELAEEWFENYAKNALRSTTYERMVQLTHRVYPAIGHLRIDKINARQLQGFVNSLAQEGANEKTGKPLAPKTIRHNLSFISDVFSYAVRMDLVSDKSQRSLKFPQSVMDLLREYKAEQDEERVKLGTKWQDYDRLFVKWDGRPMNNNTPYFWLKEFCEENNFRFCDIHSLRHFYASALINEGVDAATVSGALGHSTITTTTSIYCHVFNQAQARAGDAIASVLDFKKHGTDKGQPEAV